MRIGIYGGCFNPPHIGHEFVAHALLERQIVDRVIFVPTGDNYLKKDLIDGEIRYELLSKICRNDKRISISRMELSQTRRYTYQTMSDFKKQYPNDTLLFICGMDNLEEFDTWKNWEEILKTTSLLVLPREKTESEFLKRHKEYQTKIEILDIYPPDISSTEIRKAARERNIDFLKQYTSKPVFDAIISNNLYLDHNL